MCGLSIPQAEIRGGPHLQGRKTQQASGEKSGSSFCLTFLLWPPSPGRLRPRRTFLPPLCPCNAPHHLTGTLWGPCP